MGKPRPAYRDRAKERREAFGTSENISFSTKRMMVFASTDMDFPAVWSVIRIAKPELVASVLGSGGVGDHPEKYIGTTRGLCGRKAGDVG